MRKIIRRKFFHWGSRTSRLCLEGLAVLLVIFLLSALLIGWRLSSGPVDISFASDFIENALHDAAPGYHTDIERVELTWPHLQGPVTLQMHNVQVSEKEHVILDVEEMGLGLAGKAILAGRIAPVALMIKGPSLHFIRSEENQLRIALEGETAATGDGENNKAEEKTFFETILETLSSPTPARGSALSSLHSVEVTDARMIVEDHIMGITWFLPQLDFLLMRQAAGLITTVSLPLPGGHDKAAWLNGEGVYYYDGRGLKAEIYLQDIDPRILARKIPSLQALAGQDLVLNGDITLWLNNDLTLRTIDTNLIAEQGSLQIPALYSSAFPYEKIGLAASANIAEKQINIQSLNLNTQGVRFELSGTAGYQADHVESELSLKVPSLPQEKIAWFWPESFTNEALRTWLVNNLSDGVFEDIVLTTEINSHKSDKSWDISAEKVNAFFKLRDMSVNYRAPLLPARAVAGTGTYNLKNDLLDIAIDSAQVGELDIAEGTVQIDKVTGKGVGTAKISLPVKGPIPAVFDYIASEPIALTKESLGLETADIKGTADLVVDIAFPTAKNLKAEQVEVDVAGALKDMVLPNAVENMELTGPSFNITVGDNLTTLAGDGFLSGRPVQFSWAQYLDNTDTPFSSRIEAKLQADEAMRYELGIDLSDWLEGPLPVDATYTSYPKGRADVQLKADLKPARLMTGPFQYQKEPGIAGTASATALLNQGSLSDIKDLTIQTAAITLEAGSLNFAPVKGAPSLQKGKIGKLRIKETEIALELKRAADRGLNIAVSGPFLDARAFLHKDKNTPPKSQAAPAKSDKGKEAMPQDPPLVVSVDVARMRTADQHLIKAVKMFFKRSPNGLINHLEMDAIAGKGELYIRLKPDDTGKTALRLEADDAGATLRAFDLYDNIVGGQLVISGNAIDPAHNNVLHGVLQFSDFQVKNAPVLAQLINGISPSGFPALLSGEGLSFARLESEFEWHRRPTGDFYRLENGRTSGSSLGLTFEGDIDKGLNKVEVTGHVVPISELNALLSSIPILGTLLAGGKDGAVFAATYKISGPADDPTVFVNPLAALTPGIIRRILFEDK